MKIVHVCLIGPYTDYLGYQENFLMKYQSKIGHEISMITNRWIYNEKGEIIESEKSRYRLDNVDIYRLNTRFNAKLNSKFKVFINFYDILSMTKPDILFVHGFQFVDMINIIKYLKRNTNIRLIVDEHSDFSNSATNLISKYFLHGMIWKTLATYIKPYVSTFFGVLPIRCLFLEEMYNIEQNKIKLLEMGIDDEVLSHVKSCEINKEIKKFIIVTGGKIDKYKSQVIELMKIVNSLKVDNLELMIFGSITDDLIDKFNENMSSKIRYYGWLDNIKTAELMNYADLVVFPGRHSVLWELAAGLGKPMVLKFWPGLDHLNNNGNIHFVYNNDELEIIIRNLISDKNELAKMKKNAELIMNKFLYSEIAKKSLEI